MPRQSVLASRALRTVLQSSAATSVWSFSLASQSALDLKGKRRPNEAENAIESLCLTHLWVTAALKTFSTPMKTTLNSTRCPKKRKMQKAETSTA